jgi:hypothetical protein
VKVVARPERVQLLEHGADVGNCLPGMIDRTVYVGATHHVIVRLATGHTLQVSIANTGVSDSYRQGTPVAVHVPADALRILADHRGRSSAAAVAGAPREPSAGASADAGEARPPEHLASVD